MKAIRYTGLALFLRQHIGDGEIEGKHFQAGLVINTGSIVIDMDGTQILFPMQMLVGMALEIAKGSNKVEIEVEEKEGSIKEAKTDGKKGNKKGKGN